MSIQANLFGDPRVPTDVRPMHLMQPMKPMQPMQPMYMQVIIAQLMEVVDELRAYHKSGQVQVAGSIVAALPEGLADKAAAACTKVRVHERGSGTGSAHCISARRISDVHGVPTFQWLKQF